MSDRSPPTADRPARRTIDPDLANQLKETATALADAAHEVTLSYFRSGDLDTRNKHANGFDPVTEADRAAERAMRAILAERRPADAILGEEYGTEGGSSGLTWVLDPIDGTRAFMSGVPTWGVLIAIADDAGPLFGIIDQPYIGERWQGGLGIADFERGGKRTPLSTLPPKPLDEALLFSTFPEIGTAAERQAFERVANRVRLTRYGTDCYAYGLLALGQIDLVIEAGLNPYDICAPIAVIEAAGGLVTDWQGNPVHTGGQVLAAANPQIHAEALALLKGA